MLTQPSQENWGNRQSVEEIRQAHVSNGGK
jgi:hypothetical protein